MSSLLLNYKLNRTTAQNPDGSFKLAFTDATVVSGPGTTAAGKFHKALDLGTQGKGAVDIGALAIDCQQFTLRVVFQVNGPLVARAELIASDRLPFTLFLMPRGATDLDLVASVSPVAHGWRLASTHFTTELKPGIWYVADLVYDIDTLALFVDEAIMAVHAFSHGTINELPGRQFFVGTSVDGTRNHFNGRIAAIQWSNGIPEKLQAQVDERRSHPEWFITYKLESLRPQLDLGEPGTAISYQGRSGAYLQHFQNGGLMYHDSVGAAFEMHGAIYSFFRSLKFPSVLGYLVTDEIASTNASGRKNIFTKGAIYWSQATDAVAVLGQIYLDYEALGEAGVLGFPVQPVHAIPGGREQQFQQARMYHKNREPSAHEVHGVILDKYLALGGPASWGFPITHERPVQQGAAVIGMFSEFERCTIYFSTATGAFEVDGDIRERYQNLGGPAGALGFPVSDQMALPGTAGARFSRFQRGSLIWYGSPASIVMARPFHIFIGRINARESEGLGRGENDMYIYIKVLDGDQVVYDERHPSSGDYGGRNIVELNFTIPVEITPDPTKSITLSVEVWESDGFSDDDDFLGTWLKVLDVSNGWGLNENNGILDSGPFLHINSITAAVHPVVDLATLTNTQMFWGTGNPGTDDLTYQQYAAAFTDVDSDTEVWDPTDWLERAFYELVVKDIAEQGNCYGMSLEAIYARKGCSLFTMPLNGYTWDIVRPEVNVRHCYQAGAGPIWWFLGQLMSGRTHDPVKVFNGSRDEFNRGNHPILCITQNPDFSGAPHAILPVAWDSSTNPWRITISDPNFPNVTQTMTVNPDTNEFDYLNYHGGKDTGGRFHYIPYSMLSTTPHTPIWDAIMMILGGKIILLGADAETESLTDGQGRDLHAYGERAKRILAQGETLDGFFAPFKGSDARKLRQRGKGTVAGEILLSGRMYNDEVIIGPAGVDLSDLAHLPLAELTFTRGFRAIRNAVFQQRLEVGRVANRALYYLANDREAMRKLKSETRRSIRAAANTPLPGDFRHVIVGVRTGSLEYAVKHGLSEFHLSSDVRSAERIQIGVDRLGTSANTIKVKSGRDKLMRLELTNKLGVAGEHVQIAIEQLAITSAAPLQLNLKPGLGSLELISSGAATETGLEVSAVIDRQSIRRSFRLAIEGGMRLKLSNVISQGVLGVSQIDNLLGPGMKPKIITGGP